MKFLYRNIRLISKIHSFKVAMFFLCSCVSVCTIYISEPCERSVQIECELYDDLGGSTTTLVLNADAW